MIKTDTENPFFNAYSGPRGSMRFDLFKKEHYVPAITALIEEAEKDIDKITANPDEPTFENTLEALQFSGEKLDAPLTAFFNLLSSEADAEFHSMTQEISPLVSQHKSNVSLNEKLFQRIKTLHDKIDTLNLRPDQKRFLDTYYKGFVRNGALLDKKGKQELRALDEEASVLSPKFAENVLKDTNSFELHITEKSELSGLPESALEAAEIEAKNRKKTGWVFTLQAPSFMPLLKYCDNRAIREKVNRAFRSRGRNGETDNTLILKRIAEIRHERAQLLGFKNHAEFVLEERMAKKPEKVHDFLERLRSVSYPAAQRELDELKEFAKSEGFDEDLKSWDIPYYSEKLRQKKYSFDEEKLRPYFQLEKVVQGVFEHARKLYGIRFLELQDIPTYHPDVKTYLVEDEKTGKEVALLYADFFPRETKRGGAWMTSFLEQGIYEGVERRPHVSIVCNFSKPTIKKPSLLTFDEVRTLFHEFGHALHGMLSQCTYRSQSGTNVSWDFVELPSQIMENWCLEKESLDLFAEHFETGEKIPTEMIQKIIDASKFHAGMFSLRQLKLGLLDMAWHDSDPSAITDVEKFEEESTAKASVIPHEAGTSYSHSFSHIFAGGYSAGYYSYKWSEVLDADAFQCFKEKGIFDTAVAQSFKVNILEKGDTEDAMELYKKFRGREPDPDALLRRDGLL